MIRTGGVLDRYHSQEFPSPWQTVCSERNFCVPSVRIGTVIQIWIRTAHVGCVNTNYTYLGGPVAHCTPGTTPTPLSAVHSTMYNPLQRTAFSYTFCTCLYSSQIRSQTVHIGCVNSNYTYLGGPIVNCIRGLRLRDRSHQFTIPCTTICSERHFRTSSVRICTVPQSVSPTAHLGCKYTNCTYLGNPVAHCTPGVQLRNR